MVCKTNSCIQNVVFNMPTSCRFLKCEYRSLALPKIQPLLGLARQVRCTPHFIYFSCTSSCAVFTDTLHTTIPRYYMIPVLSTRTTLTWWSDWGFSRCTVNLLLGIDLQSETSLGPEIACRLPTIGTWGIRGCPANRPRRGLQDYTIKEADYPHTRPSKAKSSSTIIKLA